MTAAAAGRRREWPLTLCCLVGLAGLVVLTFDDWRRGILVFAGGVLLAGLLRLVLSDETAGLLRVRRRMFDVVILLAFGAAILTLGLAVPP